MGVAYSALRGEGKPCSLGSETKHISEYLRDLACFKRTYTKLHSNAHCVDLGVAL
jgi:hypothetical protein